MKQFLVPGALAIGRVIRIAESDHHYLVHVRRLRAGDEARVVDRFGERGVARVADVRSDSLSFQITSIDTKVSQPGPDLVLCQAIPKGRRLDQVIRSAVQAGARRIIPLFTHHTVVRDDGGWSGKMDRLNRVAREATQQSGAPPVVIDEPVPLDKLDLEAPLVLYLHTEPIDHSTLHGYLDEVPQAIAVVVGPEGGFREDEIHTMDERGYKPLYLGSQVLRSETAGLFALAAIQIVVMERQHWQLVRKHTPSE